MGDVVKNIHGLTVGYQSVTQTERNLVVVSMVSVVILQNIVLVKTVQITDVYTESGENQMVHRSGDMTEGVVVTTPYLTVHLVSVILTGINRVVVMVGMESVVTLLNIVLVNTVQTTNYSKSGMNQEVHRSGDTTGGVV